MPIRRPPIALATSAILSLVVCATTSGPVVRAATAAAARAPDHFPTAFDSSPSPSAIALDVQAIVADIFRQAATAPHELVAAARATEIERSGLGAIDPGAPTALSELQSQAEAAFAAYLADASPALEPQPDASPGPAAGSPAPSPSPEGASVARFAMARPGPGMDAPRFDQGSGYLSSIGEVLGFASRQIGDFRPSKERQGGRLPAFERDGSRYRIDMVADRDTITLLIEHTERYSVPGATADASAFGVTDSGTTTLQVDACPDEDGTIVVTANASGTYDVDGGGLTYHASLDTTDRATVTVDDEARVAARDHALSVRGSAVGDRPGFAGGAGAVDAQLDATLTWSGATSDIGPAPAVTLTTAQGVDTRDVRAAFAGGAFTAALVDAAIDAAASVWRDGRCLELRVEPAGMTVDPGSQTAITVTLEHTAFDEEVERDVRASLAGTKEVDPADQPVRAPATFSYTATDAQQGEGTITFRSVSNRGIAERTETYRVDGRLVLDVDGRVTYRFPGGSARGTLKGRGLVVRLVPGDDPSAAPGVTITGDLRVRLRASTPGCSGDGDKRYAVDSGLDASATIVGEGEDRRLSILLRPAQASAQLAIRVQCDGMGATMKFPIRNLFPHFTTGGELLIPLSGGEAKRSGTVEGVRSTFTFTLRREPSPG